MIQTHEFKSTSRLLGPDGDNQVWIFFARTKFASFRDCKTSLYLSFFLSFFSLSFFLSFFSSSSSQKD